MNWRPLWLYFVHYMVLTILAYWNESWNADGDTEVFLLPWVYFFVLPPRDRISQPQHCWHVDFLSPVTGAALSAVISLAMCLASSSWIPQSCSPSLSELCQLKISVDLAKIPFSWKLLQSKELRKFLRIWFSEVENHNDNIQEIFSLINNLKLKYTNIQKIFSSTNAQC